MNDGSRAVAGQANRSLQCEFAARSRFGHPMTGF